MKRTLLASLLVGALLLAACGPSPANEIEEQPRGAMGTEPASTQPAGTEPMATEPAATEPAATEPAGGELPGTGEIDPGLANTLMDFEVQNFEGEVIGAVSDIIFNLETKGVDYIVVELDADGRLVAAPWEAFGLLQSADSFSLQLLVEQAALDSAPDFDPASLPEAGRPAADYDADLASYWSAELAPADEGAAPTEEATDTALQGVALASEFIGANVGGTDGAALGTIEDVVIGAEAGSMTYVVINTGDSLVPVPGDLLGWDETSSSYILTVDAATLEAAPSFAAGEFPNTQESGWDAEVSLYWSNPDAALPDTGGQATPTPQPTSAY